MAVERFTTHARHTLVYRYGGRTWVLGRWWEEWTCRGCGIRFYLKGKRVQDVAKMTHRLQNEHGSYMSWVAVFNQLAGMKWDCRELGIKFKADLTRSVYGRRDEAYGLRR